MYGLAASSGFFVSGYELSGLDGLLGNPECSVCLVLALSP